MSQDLAYLEKKVFDIKIKALDLSKEVHGLRHFGGAFSSAHILTVLYKKVLRNEDTFILSKGHSCATWYPLLIEEGLNPKMAGHPAHDPENGIYMTTGSLGHGFPVGLGVALSKKIKNEPGNVYVLIGDGECQEGSVYETLALAEELGLDNLVGIVDNNKIQGSGHTNNSTIPRMKKSAEIGWEIYEVDGHSIIDLFSAISNNSMKPKLIIANTIKGNGVSFMENNPPWHSKAITEEEYVAARKELMEKMEALEIE